MIELGEVSLYTGSKEEILPEVIAGFPHIASRVRFQSGSRNFAPWHWHKSVELFYIAEGALEYHTPKGKWIFPAGSGGMVNSNMLHMTRLPGKTSDNMQLLHIFDAALIAGAQGGWIEQKYVLPISMAQNLELIALYPENPQQKAILDKLAESFQMPEDDFGYEIQLRNILSEIWIQLFAISRPLLDGMEKQDKKSDKMKCMMVYVHEHYKEKIRISELAASGYCSERDCYRLFKECLHMTPVEYITSYRLQCARQMLAEGGETITYISQACCLGSSSYFAKLFREEMGCSPLDYRQKWQNSDI